MKKLLVIFLISVPLIFCSCSNSKEIDNMVYVIAIGVDKGTEDEYMFSFQLVLPLNIEKGFKNDSEDEKGGASLLTEKVEASNIYSAITYLNENISKEISLSHLKLILVSKDYLAENPLSPGTGIFADKDVLPSAYIAAAFPDAYSVLSCVNSPLELNPARYYDLVFENKYSSYSAPAYLTDINFSGTYTVPCFSKGEDKIECTGNIILDNGNYGFEVSFDESPYLNLLYGNANDFTVDFPAYNYTAVMHQYKNPRIKINRQTKTADITLYISGEINTNSSKVSARYKEMIEERVKKHCKYILEKSAEQQCDILNIKTRLRKNFYNIKEYKKYIGSLSPSDYKYSLNINCKI